MKNIIHSSGSLEGFITLSVKDADGKVRKSARFKNLITNFAINTMFSTPTNFQAVTIHCAVGTGNTTPSAADTALTTQNGTRSATAAQISLTNTGSPNYVTKLIRSYTFAIGAVSGNLTEVGFFQATTGSNCGSRSLIKDGSGNPTSFPVLVTEQLTVTYESQYVPVLTDVVSSVTIASVLYSTTVRPHSINNTQSIMTDGGALQGINTRAFDGVLGAVTSGPVGNQSAATSVVAAAYTTGNFYRDFTYTWNPASTSNLSGGVRTITHNTGLVGNPGFQTQFTPIIPKTTLQTLTLTMRYGITRP